MAGFPIYGTGKDACSDASAIGGSTAESTG